MANPRRRAYRNALGLEELIIFGNPKAGTRLKVFGNPLRIVATKKEADEARAELEAQGYRVSIHPMAGHTYQVFATKKNPDETAAAVSLRKKFTGAEATEIIELQREAVIRLDYAGLGDLIALGMGPAEFHGDQLVTHWDQLEHIDFIPPKDQPEDTVKLASATDGRSFYFIGGNQDLSGELHKVEDVDPTKDAIDLGEAGFIVYDERKRQSDFEPTTWVHEFGEETGILPRIVYKQTPNPQTGQIVHEIGLYGGDYYIDLVPALSPGIEN